VVKALRNKSEGPGIDSRCRRGFFPWHLSDPCALGLTQPAGKCGRCVRLTTYHLRVPIVKKSRGLNLLEPCGPLAAFNGIALPLFYMFRPMKFHHQEVRYRIQTL
jgi:hypothetical protein